ncbi:hypothetical protein T05_9696 [Trichinella murrelli]|uniref:Uncharacterized protein n=1 Tax=Trichinella murrelli TaxID=144512 RepID=A0A0V0TQ70_9BILA|nr:hypothetical protein T05_9696 [Trichinella murrelli]
MKIFAKLSVCQMNKALYQPFDGLLAIGTLLDCWGRPHPTLEKHVYKAGNSSKNSVHDGIKPFIGKKCDKIFVKKSSFFNLSRARYSAHFDTKLSSIVIHWPPPGASLACVYQYRLV